MESTAAATAYGLMVSGQKNALIVDMGGGTTDLTLVRIAPGGIISVQATGGNNALGGKNIDSCLLDLVVKKWVQQLTSQPGEYVLPSCKCCVVPI